MSETHDDILEDILEWGGPAADLAAFIWPHLPVNRRPGVITDGAGDSWAMAEAVLERCPVDVVVPEDILAAFEEEAKGYAAQGDVYARMGLEVIRKHRKYHVARPAGAGVEESPGMAESSATP